MPKKHFQNGHSYPSKKSFQINISGRKPSRLRLARLLAGLTQDELSLKTGINISRISRIENGFLPGTPKEKAALSMALKNGEHLLFPNKIERTKKQS